MLRIVVVLIAWSVVCAPVAAEEVDQETVRGALRRSISFFRENCGKQGGYVYRYSRDLKLSEGEAETGPTTVWVQPPGTPAVGEAFLDAYQTTGEAEHLRAAIETAHVLTAGQLQSGGWFYRIELDASERAKWGYRDNQGFRLSKQRKNATNITTLDDDTTPAAVRLLCRVDQALKFKDPKIHEAALFALQALIKAQYPNGGWYQNWDRYPEPKTAAEFPIVSASYPTTWSRKWLNDWPGVYYTNDNVAGMMVETMLLAWEIYGDDAYLTSARRTGDFLILAQMPDPQPAWAQQYDAQMHPCWDRKMEPPAVSSWESQFVLEALLRLYRATGDSKFLTPMQPALDYLKRSRLEDGRLARFYELQTNRPLYQNKEYELTYDPKDTPTHYGFIMESRLDAIETEFQAVSRQGRDAPVTDRREPVERRAKEVARVIAAMDNRGAWLDPRSMRGFGKASPEGVYQSETFIANVATLCRYLRQSP